MQWIVVVGGDIVVLVDCSCRGREEILASVGGGSSGAG